jgi:hypothetical protein
MPNTFFIVKHSLMNGCSDWLTFLSATAGNRDACRKQDLAGAKRRPEAMAALRATAHLQRLAGRFSNLEKNLDCLPTLAQPNTALGSHSVRIGT